MSRVQEARRRYARQQRGAAALAVPDATATSPVTKPGSIPTTGPPSSKGTSPSTTAPSAASVSAATTRLPRTSSPRNAAATTAATKRRPVGATATRPRTTSAPKPSRDGNGTTTAATRERSATTAARDRDRSATTAARDRDRSTTTAARDRGRSATTAKPNAAAGPAAGPAAGVSRGRIRREHPAAGRGAGSKPASCTSPLASSAVQQPRRRQPAATDPTRGAVARARSPTHKSHTTTAAAAAAAARPRPTTHTGPGVAVSNSSAPGSSSSSTAPSPQSTSTVAVPSATTARRHRPAPSGSFKRPRTPGRSPKGGLSSPRRALAADGSAPASAPGLNASRFIYDEPLRDADGRVYGLPAGMPPAVPPRSAPPTPSRAELVQAEPQYLLPASAAAAIAAESASRSKTVSSALSSTVTTRPAPSAARGDEVVYETLQPAGANGISSSPVPPPLPPRTLSVSTAITSADETLQAPASRSPLRASPRGSWRTRGGRKTHSSGVQMPRARSPRLPVPASAQQEAAAGAAAGGGVGAAGKTEDGARQGRGRGGGIRRGPGQGPPPPLGAAGPPRRDKGTATQRHGIASTNGARSPRQPPAKSRGVDIAMPAARVPSSQTSSASEASPAATRRSELFRREDAERLQERITALKPLERAASGVTLTGRRLGEGHFGRVEEAHIRSEDGKSSQLVAIKIGHEGFHEGATELYSEASIMMAAGTPRHENVLNLLGIVVTTTTPWLIMEQCGLGDLLTVLRKHRPGRGQVQLFSNAELVSFAKQIASGMGHLESLHIVHRDLACRNVLVTNQLICKISDYGLARRTESGPYVKSSGGRVAFKWIALETLTLGESTSQSDVWSFGVVLWEILTLGENPYATVLNDQLLSFLKGGRRLPPPLGCPPELAEVMQRCWREAPDQRPTFGELQSLLGTIFEAIKATRPKDAARERRPGRFRNIFKKKRGSGEEDDGPKLDPHTQGAILQAVKRGELDVSEASDLFERYSEGALLASADECLTPGEEGAAKLIKRFRQLRLPLSRRESFV